MWLDTIPHERKSRAGKRRKGLWLTAPLRVIDGDFDDVSLDGLITKNADREPLVEMAAASPDDN